MGKTRFHVYAALVFALFSSIILPISLSSCNGNGGGSDSYGELYSLGGGGGSGSSGQAQSGGDISAIDILNYSNADDMETVVAILLGGGGGGTDETRTQTVTLSADDIGLPSGGTATLTISGNGVDYTATATADADGNVTFEIPAITTGSNITVSLSVKNSAGTLLYSGSQTEQLTGDNFTINVKLYRQYWTLPASLTVTASPSAIAYEATSAGSDTVLFSIAGLDDKPAGITLSYSWKDADGNVVGSGDTLNRTVSELVGSGYTPPADGETLSKSYTVTVSCTDEAGAACTADGSRTVTVGVPVTLSAFDIECTAPASHNGPNSSGTCYALVNMTDPFTFTVQPASPMPTGTVFTWTFTKGGTSIEKTGASVSVAPSELGTIGSSSGSATGWKVSCTASHPLVEEDKYKKSEKNISVFLLTIPNLSVSVTSVNLTAVGGAYRLSDATLSTAQFQFHAMPNSGVFPAYTNFEWKIGTTTLPDTSNLFTTTASSFGITAPSSVMTYTVTCKAWLDGVEPKTATTTLVLGPCIQLNAPSLGLTVTGATPLGGMYVPSTILYNATITLSASGSQPAGVTVKYEWYVNNDLKDTTGSSSCSKTVKDGFGFGTSYGFGVYNFYCRAVSDDLSYSPSDKSNGAQFRFGQ